MKRWCCAVEWDFFIQIFIQRNMSLYIESFVILGSAIKLKREKGFSLVYLCTCSEIRRKDHVVKLNRDLASSRLLTLLGILIQMWTVTIKFFIKRMQTLMLLLLIHESWKIYKTFDLYFFFILLRELLLIWKLLHEMCVQIHAHI